MTSLHVGDGLDLPLGAVTETFAVLAKRGSGKTYLGSVLAEEMLEAGQQVVILDPVGVWWGLRSSADGTGPGYPVVIFGGDHADVPLEETAGELIADVLIDEHVPAVLDLSGLTKSAQRRFTAAFLERLYHRNRDALHVIVDEADAFAPQRVYAGGERLLGAMDDLVRRGRARGLGVTLITQRPAVLNKDVLTQAEVLVALRMTGPRDVAAIDDWVSINAEPAEAAEVKRSLPALPVGTAWFWSPGWLGDLRRVEVRRRRTFDSSATPKAGQRQQVPRGRADVDLTLLGERIAATVERAQADDPKRLHARIGDLERQLADALAREPIVQRVEVPILAPEIVDQLEAALSPAVALIGEAQETLAKHRMWVEDQLHTPKPPAAATRTAATAPRRAPAAPPEPRPTRPATETSANLPKAQRAILTVLAQHGTRNVRQVALLTAYSGKSGGFRNALSSLRTAGYIDGRGDITITPEGGDALGDWEPLPTGRALHAWWDGQLGKAERAILDVAVHYWPNPVPVAQVADLTGYSVTSGGFRNALSRLRTLELVSGRGEVTAAEELVR